MKPYPLHAYLTYEDLQGLRRLAEDAVLGTTQISESLHQAISSLGGASTDPAAQSKGIRGLVYGSIKRVTRLTSSGANRAFRILRYLPWENRHSRQRENILSILNGVCGDYLERKENPLAIKMSFRQHGRSLSEHDFETLLEGAKPKLLLMVHGSCMSDLRWSRKGHDHGQSLAQHFRWNPLYLHYNSGRHISTNGQELAKKLQSLVEHPNPPEINVICHSMGGLVMRSACYYASAQNQSWLRFVRKIVFIGTPHHGAPLEGLGQWIDELLPRTPYSSPFSKLASLRSDGINDLRYGSLLVEDWSQPSPGDGPVTPIPLPQGIPCFAVAGTLSNPSETMRNQFIGDGLVPLNSALGRHHDMAYNLNFNASKVFQKTSHMRLLESQNVYAQLIEWLKYPTASKPPDSVQ